jgi:hypothetical protein
MELGIPAWSLLCEGVEMQAVVVPAMIGNQKNARPPLGSGVLFYGVGAPDLW